MSGATKTTPMMAQWHACKAKAGDALLFFRLGDFYEAFYEDAKTVAAALDLTLTQRQGVPMCGVPWHTAEGYIDRLVSKGYRVAVAEQMEDPKKTKGMVRREIVRFVTPGTLVNSSLLEEKNHNFICALTRVGAIFGLASLDLTTTFFQVSEWEDEKELLGELFRLRPSEIVVSNRFHEKHLTLFKKSGDTPLVLLDEWHFDHQIAYSYLTRHFQVHHLDGFGLKGMVGAINAAGALLAYLQEKLSLPTSHIQIVAPYFPNETLLLDEITQKNLELTESVDGSAKSTLLSAIDRTKTAMGGRRLREWLKKPLLSVEEIGRRQDAVEALVAANELGPLEEELKEIRDLERLTMKITTGFAGPRDLLAWAASLEHIAPIKERIDKIGSELLFSCGKPLVDLKEMRLLIKNGLVAEPPARLTDGKIFREGYSAQLDELRLLAKGGKEWLASYQAELKESTGIKNLKIGFNKIFGYYIEVSKGQAEAMPATFQRRQTLVNAERFVSPLLQEYENKVLSAEEQMVALEEELFCSLREKAASYGTLVFEMARALADIDVLCSFARVAKELNLTRPVVDSSEKLEIVGGRHLVIEKALGKERFIPNDLELDGKNERLMLITGPNMAGKSTFIRQSALIVIMAQMGSFVPASRAHIGIVDRIFTRIGASDDLARGQSTFMVEMSETARILNHATNRSLVILDEIGRGTSTYDGVAIAWAVAEYLLTSEGRSAKTLFATHYWELTELENAVPGAINYHAAVQEWNEEIIFLHKIIKGIADRSYGIHVARLAGLPFQVITRAQMILKKLESRKDPLRRDKRAANEMQLTLF